jgi:hypothetical protein
VEENDDEIGVDRKPATSGNQDAPFAPTLLAQAGGREQAMNGVNDIKAPWEPNYGCPLFRTQDAIRLWTASRRTEMPEGTIVRCDLHGVSAASDAVIPTTTNKNPNA